MYNSQAYFDKSIRPSSMSSHPDPYPTTNNQLSLSQHIPRKMHTNEKVMFNALRAFHILIVAWDRGKKNIHDDRL